MTLIHLENFILNDHTAVTSHPDRYLTFVVDSQKILKSWKRSLFSFEWLKQNGDIKPIEAMAEAQAKKRQYVEECLKNGIALEKPILGIGVQENVEIGVGRAEFLTLAAHGIIHIPVHILRAHESDFQRYRILV